MGLTEHIGYALPRRNALQRLVTTVAGTRPGGWLLSRVQEPLDRWWRRLSSDSYATNVLAGLPVVELTTTGARSGRPRTVTLIGVPYDGELALVGTNYGQRRTPGWVFNLESDPRVELGYGSKTVEVVARRADEIETDQVFEIATGMYPGYARYRSRAAHREIRVFILETAD